MSNRHGTAHEIKEAKRNEAELRAAFPGPNPVLRQKWYRRMIAKHGGICPDVECCPSSAVEE